jgi:hypothetical protein
MNPILSNKSEGGSAMKTSQANQKQDSIKVVVNGRPITLFFVSEPNQEAADYIKKALINSYLVKTV